MVDETKPEQAPIKVGRPRHPRWSGLGMVERLLTKVDLATRKINCKITPSWWAAIELEASCIDIIYPGWRKKFTPGADVAAAPVEENVEETIEIPEEEPQEPAFIAQPFPRD